jgi:hypothetical protein
MSSRSAADLLALRLGERKRIGPGFGFGCDAIPKVLDEPKALFKAKVKQVEGSDRAHSWKVARGNAGDQVCLRGAATERSPRPRRGAPKVAISSLPARRDM